MIRGVVNANYEAVVRLRVRGPSGNELDVEAVVDSGFNASLTLPLSIVSALGLIQQSVGGAVLADGSIHEFEIYSAEVDWNGWRPILVSAVGDQALAGMRLLHGNELRIEVVQGGVVEVRPLT